MSDVGLFKSILDPLLYIRVVKKGGYNNTTYQFQSDQAGENPEWSGDSATAAITAAIFLKVKTYKSTRESSICMYFYPPLSLLCCY